MRRTATVTALIGIAVTTLAPVVAAAPARAAETCDGKVPTIVVPESTSFPVTPVQGTAGEDVILGSSRMDVIDGLGGDDTICGLAGADRIFGGEGDDRLFGGLDEEYFPDDGYYGDYLAPGPGDDFVDLGHDPASEDIWWGDRPYLDVVSFEDAPGPVTVDLAAGTASGEGTDTIVVPRSDGGVAGSAYDDTLAGTDGVDFLVGGGGDDTIRGLGGDDLLSADGDWAQAVHGDGTTAVGDDEVEAGAGNDTVLGNGGVDDVRGDGGNDYVELLDSDEGTVLRGGPGKDVLYSGGVADLHGDAGKDTLWPTLLRKGTVLEGGSSADRLTLDVPRKVAPQGTRIGFDRPRGVLTLEGKRFARFIGLEGVDFNVTSQLRVTYVGGPGADFVNGNGMREVRAFGRGGQDRLFGSEWRDLLDGGPGRDVLDGGDRRDRCLHGERLRSCEVRR